MMADGDEYAQHFTLTPIGAPLLAQAGAGAPPCYTARFRELPGQDALPARMQAAWSPACKTLNKRERL